MKTPSPQIQIKRKYNHPIDKVWDAITSAKALSEWLMETNDFLPEINHSFQLKTTPRGKFDGIIKCKILEINAPNFIQYSWLANEMPQPTIVTWELKEVTKETTILTLSHNGFIGMNGWVTKVILRFGWKTLLGKKIEKYLSK